MIEQIALAFGTDAWMPPT